MSDLPKPYNSVKVLPFDPHAHFGPTQKFALEFLINKTQAQTVIEIGSYLGASTRFIAKHLPENGTVFAVDHWQGNNEWQRRDSFKEVKPILYQKFLSNVIHENLCHKIVPVKMTSLEASKELQVEPDLVFIDGSHDFKSVYEDLNAWYPFVRGHGILCGDDYNWGRRKPVKRAVHKFAKEHNLTVKVLKNWVFYFEEN